MTDHLGDRNWRLVVDVAQNMKRGEVGLMALPMALKKLIADEAWRSFVTPLGKTVEHVEFASFVKAEPPEGLGADVRTLEHLCRDDEEALLAIREAVKGKHGGDRRSEEAKTKRDIVTLDRGNDRSYTLERLERDRPDLYERVLADELSANAAAIEAGFRRRTITVPADPENAARTLRRRFSEEDLRLLIKLIEETL